MVYNVTVLLSRYSWVKIHSTTYKPGSVVIANIVDDYPRFCRIEEVVSNDAMSFFFVLKELAPPEYCPHFHAYIVNKQATTNICVSRQKDLYDHHSYVLQQSFDISLKNIETYTFAIRSSLAKC